MLINKCIPLFIFAVLLFSCLNIATGNDEFPYRKKYPGVPPISTDDLAKKYNSGKAVIVDVRSKIEYEVIHPVGAFHIPLSHKGFLDNAMEIVNKNPGKAIAFYCNGVTCLKSYNAAQKAIENGCKSCFVYDAGIPDWVNVFPGKTLLLGKPVVDSKKQIIPKSEFKKKCLSFKEFKSKANSPDAVVIDARDHIQKTGKLPGLKKVLPIPFDKLIPNVVQKKREQDKILLIFDQVGKQVRWLEYYLVEYGYKNYFFLKGGATEVLKKQVYR